MRWGADLGDGWTHSDLDEDFIPLKLGKLDVLDLEDLSEVALALASWISQRSDEGSAVILEKKERSDEREGWTYDVLSLGGEYERLDLLGDVLHLGLKWGCRCV